MIIDAHHHLWHYSEEEFGWISPEMGAIRRNFLASDLQQAIKTARVDGTIAVQARQTLAETNWLLDVAASTPCIRGVVGWAPLIDPQISRILEPFRDSSHLRGLRHVVQAEPEGFMLRDDFNRGVSTLEPRGLCYDILIVARQLPEAIRFVDRHPKQTFILDHIAKPDIRAGGLEPWRTHILDLARRPKVYCKLSGMVTEADQKTWTSKALQPYANVILDAFGPRRVMFGSDWPVCLVACEYSRWLDVIREWIASLSVAEQHWILGKTAAEAYNLTPEDSHESH